MKKLLLILGAVAMLSPFAYASRETGSIDQVLVIPHTGGRAKFGQVDLSLSAAVKNALPIANGGTNNGSLAVTSGGLLYTDGTKVMNLGAPTNGQIAGGVAGAAAWVTPHGATSQVFGSGSGTYYLTYVFTVTSANATAAATYTNNAQTCTVEKTISASTELLAFCTGDPTSTGTLTKSTGTGDATITFSNWLKPKWLEVLVQGGGGGGGGAGISVGGETAGTGGNSSSFGSSLVSATGGGGGGTVGSGGGAGAGATISSPAIQVVGVAGGSGGAATAYLSTTAGGGPAGGQGGSSFFGGAGSAGAVNGTGGDGQIGTGGGGGGGGAAGYGSGAVYGGSGGGSGGFAWVILLSPSASYSYTVGAQVNGGGAGTQGAAGGRGASGQVSVIEHFGF